MKRRTLASLAFGLGIVGVNAMASPLPAGAATSETVANVDRAAVASLAQTDLTLALRWEYYGTYGTWSLCDSFGRFWLSVPFHDADGYQCRTDGLAWNLYMRFD
jgi:hypothetical protein